MKTMIDNLINGNLSDARHQAKKYKLVKIVDTLIEDYNWSPVKSWAAACYLKTGEGWQQYCDAK